MNLSLGFPRILPGAGDFLASLRWKRWWRGFQSLHQRARFAGPRHPSSAGRRRRLRRNPAGGRPAAARGARTARHRAALLSTRRKPSSTIAAGRNVVIVTPTASGKTLCYNLPVLNLLLRDAGARAMYLFPTKALAEDQLHELQSRGGGDGLGDPRLHLRRRYPAGRAQGHPRSAPTWCSPIPTCCTAASCRTTPSGRATSRTCATS